MGCNQSKQEDAKRDAERKRIAAQRAQAQTRAAHASPPRSASSPIASPHGAGAPMDMGDVAVGASYTDSRMEEHDFLKDIIDRTEARFIDVNDVSEHMHAQPNQSGVDLRTLHTTTDVAHSLTQPHLPIAGGERDVSALLAAPQLLGETEREELCEWGQALSDAIASTAIRDVGQLVVPFPSLTAGGDDD
eukprot:TRINITY_DN979_c0_g1_i1.p1 TRINITY_DN979_c0_g1~~TRINITY_DN979_c0_g1_i1.p1  ORF type:complete len:190 (-),score=74.05 TRINITY_DN979_c0_g1_i1:34-603(-)